MNDAALPWIERMRSGLRRTSERLGDNLSGLFTKAVLDQDTLDGIEEALIASDLGPSVAGRIVARLGNERFDRNIDVHLSSIRQKIAALGSDKSCIQTVYRLGYQFIKE